jgi:hypothetical protein
MIYNYFQSAEWSQIKVDPSSNCRYGSHDEPISDTHMLNIFQFNCAGGSSSAIAVKYVDTEAAWLKTVDHCANVLIATNESTVDGVKMIEKTYALIGATGMTTVSFYRL